MSVVENKSAFVDPTSASIAFSQMFTVTAGGGNPSYLVLSALDRAEYTAGASGSTGSFLGNGHTLQLNGLGGDGRGTGIVFTYQTASGLYYNSTYGYLNQLTFNSSSSLGDVTNISLFATNNLSIANADAGNVYSMMQADASGYLGSSTIVTQPKFSGAVPAQATPASIAAAANNFVGQAWNMDGCWVLASTIAADAGASLPVQSTAIGVPGQASDEWIVAFNGPAGQSGNWQSLVKQGEVIVIGTAGGGGHITTCVSGSGASAMLVDNVTYVNASGQVQNRANDGSSNDVVVAPPHAASQEWSGVAASSVVIYELDTPSVTTSVTSLSLTSHASQTLGALFAATDPANRSITEWQVYNTSSSDSLVSGGTAYGDHSATTALTTGSLSSVSLLAAATAATDTLEVRAFNGTYWGDWQSLNVTIASTSASPPVLKTQTTNQTWIGGRPVSLALPASAFTDPQGQALAYSAQLSNGQALPAWLTFNPATESFSGTAPTTAQTLNFVVTATDTSKLTALDRFSATVIGAPSVTAQTSNQIWTEGKAISLTLPANTFSDPQGEALSYTATLSNGQALPGWLGFDPKTETFSGTAPTTAQNLNVTVTATDSSGLTATEGFAVAIAAPAASVAPKPEITVSNPTSNQTWTDGQTAALVLPANTFTDALGLKMTFAAYQLSGPNETSWLRFNAAADELYGTVPGTASGMIGIQIIATDAQNMTASDLFNVTFAPASTHGLASLTAGLLGADPLNVVTTMPVAFTLQS